VNVGEQVMVGRDVDARVRLSDPKVSRRHVMILWSGAGWSVRDLGATNPTRLLGASGTAQPVVGEIRIASGQLLVGDVLVTLFPAGS
jgi:pSer/pThr/pTyr-binding forkhead associated (FHA) protein